MITPIITYGSAVHSSATQTHLNKIQIFQNKQIRRFTKSTPYVRNDVVLRDLKIRAIFSEIKKLVMKFHRSIPSVRNSALNSIRLYDARTDKERKRPLAILTPDNYFIPCFKTSWRNPPGVT